MELTPIHGETLKIRHTDRVICNPFSLQTMAAHRA